MTGRITIWGRTNSNNVKKALWIAEELGLAYKSEIVGGQYGRTKTPEYIALNPNSVIPTIQDGDFTLWESNAIVRYLSSAYSTPQVPLWSSDPRVRATGDKWMDWCSTTFAPEFRPVFWGLVRTPPDQQNHDQINAAIAICTGLLARVDSELARQPYLGGNEFGVGDIPLGCFIYPWFEMKFNRPNLPNLEAWYDRLKTRPAYQKAVMSPLT